MIEQLIHYISGNFLQAVILLLLITSFWHEEIKHVVYSKLGVRNGNGKTSEKMMQELSQHFNHETTHLLSDILQETRESNRKLDTVINKQEEMMKYGVPELKR
jgi:hypothetical protein